MKGCDKICYLILLIIFPFVLSYPQEQQYKFGHLTTKQGLPSNCVNSIIKDSEGFMWFGTGDGLTCYDGYNCKTYFPNSGDSSSYPNNYIRSLMEDKDGNLWIGTAQNGLYKFYRKTEVFYNYQHDPLDSSSLSNNYVYVIYQDKNDVIWVGTNGGGLNKFDPNTGKFISYLSTTHDPEYAGNSIRSLFEDRSGIFWIGTSDGVFQFDRLNNIFTPFDLGYKIPEVKRQIICIYEDMSGCLWFGTRWGLFKFNPVEKYITHFFYDAQVSFEKQLNNLNIRSIVETSENNNQIFWIATAFGLEKYNVSEEIFSTIYSDPYNSNSLSSSSVSSLYFDGSGILWIGTTNGGVNMLNLNKNEFKHYKITDPETNYRASASCFCVDREKNIWFGSSATGIYKLDSNFNIILHRLVHEFGSKDPDVANPNSIECIYKDKKGTIWVGVWGQGIFAFNEADKALEKIKIVTPGGFHEPDRIIEILEDRYGVLWFASNSAIYYMKEMENRKKRSLQIVSHDLLSQVYITSLYEDSHDYLWIGAYDNGLYCLTPSNRTTNIFIHYEYDSAAPNSITSNQITDIYEDLLGDLWISTRGGLVRWIRAKETFENYNHIIDPSLILIRGVLVDNSGFLWLNTSRGLLRFNPEIDKKRAIKIFDTKDGVPFDLIDERAFYKSGDGRIFVGGLSGSNNGFYCFYPDSIKDNTQIPPVFITNFLIRNEPVKLDSSITYKKEICLKYNKNFFSFEFAALDYTNPDKNKYSYILEGFDEDWIYSENRRHAYYTDVPPGEYTFRVKATNSDGYWNEKGTWIRISIFPPPWKTWWAYSIYGLFLIGLIVAWRRYDLKRQRLKQELEIEHVKAEKLKEFDSMKSRFFANISHEFRTPLTLILGPIEKLRSQISDGVKKDLDMMHRNARRLQNLINQLLSLSKLESGKMKLQAGEVNFVSLVNGYVQSFESLAKQKNIEFIFNSTKDNIPLFVDRDKLEKILYNLLSNAFKFTGEGGKVEVKVDSGSQLQTATAAITATKYAEIIVSDSGKGIPSNKLEHIFDRFYQEDDSYTKDQEGTGIGLTLTKELVELHHGTIKVESKLGIGTTFTVFLPLGKDHLKPDEIEVHKDSFGESAENVDQFTEPSTQETLIDDNDTEKEDSKPLLLIVEDNDDLRSYIRSYLTSDYRISEAIDGEMGLEKSIEKIPDLVISDVMMPKMDGYELCRNLKTNELTSHIPVILLTAKAALEDRLEGLETGADDFISKPFEQDELLIRIKNLINQRQKLREIFSKKITSPESYLQKLQDSLINTMDQRFLQKANELVEKNMQDYNFSVELLSSEMNMSRMQLHRKLKAIVNQSAGEFVRTIRLNRAASLLMEEYGNVTQVAFEVGFNNLSWFTKCFQEQFGVLPSEYKRNITKTYKE